MQNGQFVRIDEAAILAEARATYSALRPMIERGGEKLRPIQKTYQQIYHRCLEHEISADTYPARLP